MYKPDTSGVWFNPYGCVQRQVPYLCSRWELRLKGGNLPKLTPPTCHRLAGTTPTQHTAPRWDSESTLDFKRTKAFCSINLPNFCRDWHISSGVLTWPAPGGERTWDKIKVRLRSRFSQGPLKPGWSILTRRLLTAVEVRRIMSCVGEWVRSVVLNRLLIRIA